MAISIKIEATAQLTTVKMLLQGQLDAIGAPELEKAVTDVVTTELTTLIFDLRNMNFISSAGLRVLAKAQKLAKQYGGRVLFVNLQPQVKKVFDIVKAVRISDIFTSYAELDSYLAAMQDDKQDNGQL